MALHRQFDFETDAEWTKWEIMKYILDFARLAQSEKWNCFVLGRNSVMPLQNVLSIGHN
jgi:spore maturation protein CgeB